MPAKQMTRTRQRNPRGQGERLRDDIIEAASALMANPAAPPLTLRAVAREAGVAATSVYLHFDSIESLVLAVADRRFGELVRLQDEVRGEDGGGGWRDGEADGAGLGVGDQAHGAFGRLDVAEDRSGSVEQFDAGRGQLDAAGGADE